MNLIVEAYFHNVAKQTLRAYFNRVKVPDRRAAIF